MSPVLPYRGSGEDRPAGLVVPPARMPLLAHGRPLKRWRYVGVFGDRLMLCAGVVRIGVLPQTFWAVWDRRREALRERTRLVRPLRFVSLPLDGRVVIRDGTVAADLVVAPGTPVETASQHGPAWIWTRKQGGVRVTGRVVLDGEPIEVDACGCVDESAGYHARETAWEWSAGCGRLTDGRAVAWNLVTGVHDAERGSERTIWVAGEPVETAPVRFAESLDAVEFADGARMTFAGEATRSRTDDLLVFRSDYVQPFGTFAGTLEGGLELAEGRGVMERHSALW
ncbi:MAG TPA: DUF2804 family protein [Solirubrobacteraceae bacterium]|nr:DUF2804 family protein [Solirubrobacteraceae bacterium]